MSKTSDKASREKFGETCKPWPCTRLLAHTQEKVEKFGGKDAISIILIDDEQKTFTYVNVFGGKVGKHAKPNWLPIKSDSMKKWEKKGYTEVKQDDEEMLARIAIVEFTPAMAA